MIREILTGKEADYQENLMRTLTEKEDEKQTLVKLKVDLGNFHIFFFKCSSHPKKLKICSPHKNCVFFQQDNILFREALDFIAELFSLKIEGLCFKFGSFLVLVLPLCPILGSVGYIQHI